MNHEHHVDAAVTTGGTAVRPLPADQLYRPTNLSNLEFSTTAELQPIDGLVGQARALEGIRFGTQVGKAGLQLAPKDLMCPMLIPNLRRTAVTQGFCLLTLCGRP